MAAKLKRISIVQAQRTRNRWRSVKAAQVNQMRGLLSEFGIVIPRGIRSIHKQPFPALVRSRQAPLLQLWKRPRNSRTRQATVGMVWTGPKTMIQWRQQTLLSIRNVAILTCVLY